MKTTAHLAFAASLLALTACSATPYYGTAVLSEQAGDPTAVIDPNVGIRMTEGSAASAHIELDSQTGGTLEGDIRSQDPSVLTILHTPHDGSTYVFLARKPGLAEVFVYTNGVAVRSLNAVVNAPAALDGGSALDAGVDGGDASVDGGDASDGGDAGEPLDASDAGDGGESDAGDGSD